MSEEIKEYPFEKTFDVKFDESSLKTFNDLIKEKGIRRFKIESDLYGILDVVSYEGYEKLQQKVEQLEKENEQLKQENKRIFQNVNDDELLISNAMNYAELKKAEKRVEQLENIRKEAIDYIENNLLYSEEYDYDEEENLIWNGAYDYKEREDLLNILNKGSDKNV